MPYSVVSSEGELERRKAPWRRERRRADGDTEARVVTRRREGRRSLPHRLHGRIAKRERWLRAGRECAWTERRSLRQRECAVGTVVA